MNFIEKFQFGSIYSLNAFNLLVITYLTFNRLSIIFIECSRIQFIRIISIQMNYFETHKKE